MLSVLIQIIESWKRMYNISYQYDIKITYNIINTNIDIVIKSFYRIDHQQMISLQQLRWSKYQRYVQHLQRKRKRDIHSEQIQEKRHQHQWHYWNFDTKSF